VINYYLSMDIIEEHFGYVNKTEIKKITLKNDFGTTVSLINFGAIIQSIILPDRFGKFSEVALNYDSVEEYVKDESYFGATIGRFANRIKDGQFSIEDQEYQLTKNENGKNHLHGGYSGFNKKIWSYESWKNDRIASVRMSYLSPDGEEGYPGNLNAEVTFTLDNSNSFIINYQAVSDKKTPVNMTNHTYLNLSGTDKNKTIKGHLLKINSGFYLEYDKELIPTGRFLDVEDGAMNFKEFKRLGDNLKEVGGGLDHCYVFASDQGKMFHALTLYDPLSGRNLDVFTDKPGVQIYTANHLDPPHRAICFETQNYPDSVNHSEFPDTLISPGDLYNRTIFCRFTISGDYA
jgi:aldose 1-epimerase